MYICICNAITQADLRNNAFLIHKIGNRCGKCIEKGIISDGQRCTYLTDNSNIIRDCKEYEK